MDCLNVFEMVCLSFKNNLERSEFEARTRLGAQVETLQREVNLLKKKLESEEKHHKSIISTWEVSEVYCFIQILNYSS